MLIRRHGVFALGRLLSAIAGAYGAERGIAGRLCENVGTEDKEEKKTVKKTISAHRLR
jgi:hypothetical protein